MKYNVKTRFLSLVLCVCMLVPMLTQVIPVFSVGAEEKEVEPITSPFTPETEFLINGKVEKSQSYRIPSMVTLDDGTIVAAADIRWNTTYDGGGLDTLVARSTDGGKTWKYTVANYLGDNGNEYNAQSSTFIDPSLLVAKDGKTVYMLVDLYAYGVSLNGLWGEYSQPATDTGFDSNGNLKLSDDDHNNYNYYLKDGKIYNSSNEVVEGYDVDPYFNVTYTQNGEIKQSNLFFADSPYKVARTQYLYLTKSTDGGESWSEPTLLDVRVKAKVAATENALLVSPGNSITTSGGIMVYPVYSYKTDGTQHVALIYSTDGVNWMRSSDYTALNWSSEGSIVELQNGTLRVFVRNKTSYLCYVDFDMKTMSWIGHTQTTVPTNSNTQLSAITYSKTFNGQQVILVSCPTGPNEAGSANNDGKYRTNGKIFVGVVAADGTMSWPKSIDVGPYKAMAQLQDPNYTEDQGFFAYSCLTERSDGSVAILYENNQFGWGAGEKKYFTITAKAYAASALGIKLDAPETVVVDSEGNRINSITMGMYDKPVLTAKSPFNTADVKYQWQIEYDEGKWVDIYGEDEKTVKLSFGMVATLLDDNGMVAIRCKTTAASQVAYSKPIGVTFVITEPKEPTVEISQNVTTSNGTNVDVTVSGNIPADAELNIEDASGVEIGGVEATEITVSLDVTIKQNGAEWQPSDNEKISVSIPASQLGLQDGTYFTVYHIHNGTTELLGPFVVADGYATFEIDGFSVVVISTNYGAALGATAELSQQIILLYSDPMSLKASVTSYTSMPQKLIITDYYFDEGNARLMYKIDAAHGYTWPATLTDKHWCESTDLTNIDVNGTAGVYDADGNPVKDASVTNSAGVVVSAITSLQSADISYRWQICYDTENDLWVNISGQNDKNITIVAGMVISLKDENNQVRVRCVTSAGTKTVITEPVTITILEAQPGNDNVDVLVDGVVKENIQISASELESFNATLSANSSLTGNLTYSWEVLFDKTYDMWWLQGQSETFKPVFDPYKEGVYLDSNFIHVVDDTTSEICIRLTVSDGTTMVRNTFVITVNNDTAVASYNSVLRSVSAPATNEVTARDATSTDIYKIVINYLYYHNMQIAANPYTSTVGASTAITDPVVFPTIMGYLPYVMDENGTLVRMDEYKFNGYLTEDFEMTVYYKPAKVNYTINVYTQNAEDDNYQLLMHSKGTALTGTVIDTISMPLPGYYQTKMTTTTASVAPDGSTVFNLYYDRIYYLMKFDLDGGYGVQPIYARHGVKLDIPNPSKAGYTFVGWDQTEGAPKVSNERLNDGIANTMYEYMPIGNTAYKAIWKAVDNAKVTIVYWGENPNDEKYSYLESQEVFVKPGTTLTFGTDQLVCTLTPHTHGADCTYNCGKTPHTHSLDNNPSCYTLNCNENSHSHADSGCTLNCSHGAHVYSCYSTTDLRTLKSTTEPTATLTNIGNGIYTYTTEEWYGTATHYYLYLNGTWYCAYGSITGNKADDQAISISCGHAHTDVCYSCGKNEGTHVHSVEKGCYTLTCTTEAHTHSDTCYSCIAHTHNDDCYLKTNSQDATKYYYVKSDTVTVAADGSTVMNVYYDRVEYNVEFHSNQNCTNEYTNLRITAKWGASILNKWPTYNGSSSWLVQNKSDTWQNSIQIMPVGGAKFWGPKTGSSSYKAYYYVEALPGATGTTVHNGVTYVLHHTDVSSSSGDVTDEERYGIEGFKYKEGTSNGASYNNAKFYYVRETYLLEFNNGEGVVKTESVKYQYGLSSYAFTPTAPSYYEAGSVEFAGWYQNPECTGEEVVLSNTTMPSSNKILYAKWIPVEHDVTIYRYKNPDGSFPTGNDIIQATIKVPHGYFLQQQYIPKDPENTPYNFVGWFYMDGNTEKAFDFINMPVTKDLQIYAKWSSNVQLPYTIKYVLQGTNTEIAEMETGKQFAGETKTFRAKISSELNPGYQTGYFPIFSAHSIDFNLNDGDTSYEYTFEYVSKESVPYKVYYLAETLNEGTTSYGTMKYNGNEYYKIVEDKLVNSKDAIVTENFVQVQGYMPNAYQQSLILSGADDTVNEMYFIYTVDTTHAYYKVSHFTQNLDGDWYEYSTYESIGVIGSVYTESPRTINGFTYNSGISGTLTTGELTAQGLHLKLYYTRNKYPYKVEYKIDGSGTLLATDYFTTEELMRYYNESISVSPSRTFNGYHLVSNSPVGHIIQIEQEANMQNPVANVITFYYAEDEVTIKYEVVGPNGSGTVVPSSQTVPVISGNPMSSADATSAAYKFVGWYSDKNCTQLITDSRIIQPQKVNGLHVAATYYAKFEYNLTSLTIQKKGWNSADPNQTFIFTIAGKDANGNDMVLDVTVHGNGSTTIDGLTVGATYTITEKTDWSWRYTYGGVVTDKTTVNVTETVTDGVKITLNPTGNIITFTNSRSEDKWLDGDSWCDNIFTTAIARNVNN